MSFQSTRPSRASTWTCREGERLLNFNPQGPRGPRRIRIKQLISKALISIHKALAGLDFSSYTRLGTVRIFQSTRPSRASTWFGSDEQGWYYIFQSTRPSRASTADRQGQAEGQKISIHKALAGLDHNSNETRNAHKDFNPQGPRGPRRIKEVIICMSQCISIHKALAGLDDLDSHPVIRAGFQSTRPSRASTWMQIWVWMGHLDFNPQGPRGPRHFRHADRIAKAAISIHKALAGLDVVVPITQRWSLQISIHKALAGLDSKTIQQSLHIPLTFYALCPPLLISTSSIHSPSLFSRLFRCFSGANLPGISC